jgi:hypothetical protein
MRMRFTTTALLLLATCVAVAAPKSTRAPALPGERVLGKVKLLADMAEVELTVMEPSADVPSVVNGALSSSEADFKLALAFHSESDGVLGLDVKEAFAPWQAVHVRITNLTTLQADRLAEFDLAPHVSLGRGWYYGSHVRLPPQQTLENPFSDVYRLEITALPGPAVVLEADALPASPLWRGDAPLLLLDVTDRLGPTSRLPLGEAPAARAWVHAADVLRSRFNANDAAGASQTWWQQLAALVIPLENAAAYDAPLGMKTEMLADLGDSILSAVNGQPVHGDCGPLHASECGPVLEAALERAFTLATLQRMDAAVLDPMHAQDLWDEAFVFFDGALRTRAAAQELLCLQGPPAAPSLEDCALAPDAAFVDGANAITRGDAAALKTARSRVQSLLLKRAAHDLGIHVWTMRQPITDGPFNEQRAHARVTLALLRPFLDATTLDAILAERDSTQFTEAAAMDLISHVRQGLVPLWTTSADVCAPEQFLGGRP